MPKVESRSFWRAEVDLEIERLALSAQYMEKGRGSKKKRFLVPTDWLASDRETILFDVGKRLKGWIKEQVFTMKPSLKPRVQYGVVCKSLPEVGYVPIGKLVDIDKSRNWNSFVHKEVYDLNGLPEPNVEAILTERGQSVFALHYVLKEPITVKASISSFAYGIRPEAVRNWLTVLGPVKGLGDLHNSSAAYGTFTVNKFEVVEEKEITF